MKRIITIAALLFFAGATFSQEAISDLENIQHRIDAAFSMSFAQQENKLTSLLHELETLYAKHPKPIVAYWLAYAQHKSSIYHLALEQSKEAAAANAAAVATLEKLEELDAEASTLLGAALSLSISFNPGRAIPLSARADKNYKKALKLDPQNLRAYLSIARSDFYTPKQYGGGKIAEEYFLKAISLPEQTATYLYAPTWGKDEAYWFLVQFYQREGRIEDALLYCKQGLKKYPKHDGLNTLRKELE